jgi:hypothetical protein
MMVSGPASRIPAVASSTRLVVNRIALGPSLGRGRDALQRRLGAGWVVEDLITCVRVLEPGDVVLLGTPELPPGQVQMGRDGRVLVGTHPPGGDLPQMDGVVELLEALYPKVA